MALRLITLLYAVNTAALIVIALRDACRPQRAISWLAIGLILPILGPALYLALCWPLRIHRPAPSVTEEENSDHAFADRQATSDVAEPATTLRTAFTQITGLPPRPARVRILTNGPEKYEALVDALRRAKDTIDVEYYIYRADHVGRLITNLLLDKARAGVRVRFLRDGIGSRGFPRREVARMQAAGIECRTVFPLRFPWISPRLNYRDHCKIVVIDGVLAFVGGINIGDEYTGLKPGVGHWRDTHLCLAGEAVTPLYDVFEMNWAIATPDPPPRLDRPTLRLSGSTREEQADQPRGFGRLRLGRVRRASTALSVEFATLDTSAAPVDEQEPEYQGQAGVLDMIADAVKADVQTIQSGPDSPAENQRELFFLCLTQAQRQVEITTPYFAPDPDLVMAMKTAVARRVHVRLLVPKHPDHRLVDLASQTYYGDLLKAGVHIHQYEPGVLHAKVMTVDDSVAVVGAANYDPRSFRMNFEVSEVIYSSEVTQQLRRQFEQDLEQASLLTLRQLAARPWWRRAAERAARLLAPQL
jgi:cardiolipin synthase